MKKKKFVIIIFCLSIIGLYISHPGCDVNSTRDFEKTEPQKNLQKLTNIPFQNEPYIRGIPVSCLLLHAQKLENTYDKSIELSNIVDAYAKAKNFDRALSVATLIDSSDLKDMALASIAYQYAKAGQYERALQLATTIKDSFDKAKVQSSIAMLYVEAGQYERALEIIKIIDIRYGGFRAGVLAKIAAKYERAGQKDKAAEFFSQAIDIASTLDVYSSTNFEQKSFSLSDIARAYAEIGEYEQAIEIAATIRVPRLKVKILREIALQYGKAGQKDKADEILSQAFEVVKTMIDFRSKPFISSSLSEIVVAYAEIGLDDKALGVVETIESDREKIRALINLAGNYLEIGENERASEKFSQSIKLAELTKEDYIKANTLVEIAGQYLEIGQKDKMAEFLYIAIPLTAKLKVDLKDGLLNSIAKKYAEAKEYQQAINVAKSMENPLKRKQLVGLLECANQ